MNIRDLLNEENIIVDLKATLKTDVLKELATKLVLANPDIDLNLLTEKLIERENLSSTGIGEGIAIPHCKYQNLGGILMSFGRSLAGVDFDSIDKRPAKIFFLLVAPDTPKAAGEHLRTLAKITRILKSSDFRDALMSVATEKEIYKMIAIEDEKF